MTIETLKEYLLMTEAIWDDDSTDHRRLLQLIHWIIDYLEEKEGPQP